MPLPLRDRQIGAVEYILKKMKGSDTYDKMKDDNEYGRERLIKREDSEVDYKDGMRASVNEMMQASKSGDAEAFEKGLRAFVSMMLEAQKDEEKLEKQD